MHTNSWSLRKLLNNACTDKRGCCFILEDSSDVLQLWCAALWSSTWISKVLCTSPLIKKNEVTDNIFFSLLSFFPSGGVLVNKWDQNPHFSWDGVTAAFPELRSQSFFGGAFGNYCGNWNVKEEMKFLQHSTLHLATRIPFWNQRPWETIHRSNAIDSIQKAKRSNRMRLMVRLQFFSKMNWTFKVHFPSDNFCTNCVFVQWSQCCCSVSVGLRKLVDGGVRVVFVRGPFDTFMCKWKGEQRHSSSVVQGWGSSASIALVWHSIENWSSFLSVCWESSHFFCKEMYFCW